MAISYPLSLPTNVGMASIELRARNTVAVSMSPFTYKQQTHSYDGQMWEADVTLPPMNRDDAESWVSFLMSLKGRAGTFLLYDPSAKSARGTATSATVTGSAGDDSLSVVMTGTLKAGDYIQIGSASDATLHKVLVDQDGDGTLEVWPKLRKNRASVAVDLTSASGLFRLASNETAWSVDNASFFGISFGATEVVG
ncbi:putative tail structural protein [Roseobacter phage CRP-6]|nr:putative tail structural protein [Roseobacter phage CRP-6]